MNWADSGWLIPSCFTNYAKPSYANSVGPILSHGVDASDRPTVLHNLFCKSEGISFIIQFIYLSGELKWWFKGSWSCAHQHLAFPVSSSSFGIWFSNNELVLIKMLICFAYLVALAAVTKNVVRHSQLASTGLMCHNIRIVLYNICHVNCYQTVIELDAIYQWWCLMCS